MNIFILEEQDFKERLSDEELTYYFNLYKNGDINARNTIIEHNLKLVKTILYKNYNLYYIEKDELFPVAYYALINAVDSYDVDKNYKFSTYAYKCVINEINKFYNRKKNIIETLSLDAEYETFDSDEKTNLYEAIPDDKDFELEFDNKEFVNYLLETLNSTDRDIIEMSFGFGAYKRSYTQTEISEKYNVSKQYISVKIIKILKELKHIAESKEYRHQRMLRKNS